MPRTRSSSNINGLSESDLDLSALQAKSQASVLWLMSKAFEGRGIPDELKEPFYRDGSGQERLKALIVQSLANAELYGLALGNIYQDNHYNTMSHNEVIHLLMRKGIYIQDPRETAITESVLMQTSPIKMSAHLVMIESVMSLYIKEVLIPEKVVEVVQRFIPNDENEELPEEAEDAALYWINKSCQRFKERIEEEIAAEDDDLTPKGDDAGPPVRDNSLLTVAPNIPVVEYLWDLSDGCALASLLSFYCPDELEWKEICFNEPMTQADCSYNLQLVELFCQERLPQNIFFMEVRDLFDCHPTIRPNILALIADLLFYLEIRPAPCVRSPGSLALFNQLFLNSDEEERLREENQLMSLNGGRYSVASEMKMLSNTWDSDESERERHRRRFSLKSPPSSASAAAASFRRSISHHQQVYDEGDETGDEVEDLSFYMTALEIQDETSGPHSLSFNNKTPGRRSNSLHETMDKSKSATYSRSPGKSASKLADYFNVAETTSSSEDGIPNRNSRGTFSRLSSSGEKRRNGSSSFMSPPTRVLRNFSRDPYNRSIHNLPTDALAAASASINDIPRAGVLRRSSSSTTTPLSQMNNNSQQHVVDPSLVTLNSRLSKSRDNFITSPTTSPPKKESPATQTVGRSPFNSPLTPYSLQHQANVFNSSNNGMYVTSTPGGLSSHAFTTSTPFRSGSVVGDPSLVGGLHNHELLSPQGRDRRSSRDCLMHSNVLLRQHNRTTPQTQRYVNDSSKLRQCLLSEEEESFDQRPTKRRSEEGDNISLAAKRSESMAAVDSLERSFPLSPFNNSNNNRNRYLSHQNLSMNQTLPIQTFNLQTIQQEYLINQEKLALLQEQERLLLSAAAAAGVSDESQFTSPLRTSSRMSLMASPQIASDVQNPDIHTIRALLEEKRQRIEHQRLLQEESWLRELDRQASIQEQALAGGPPSLQPNSLMHSMSGRSLHQTMNQSNGETDVTDCQPMSMRPQPQSFQQQSQEKRSSWFIDASPANDAQNVTTPVRNKGTYLNIPWDDNDNQKSSSAKKSSAVGNKFTVNLSKSTSKSVPNVEPIGSSPTSCQQNGQNNNTIPNKTHLQSTPHLNKQPEGYVIGVELSQPSQEDEDSMAIKKAMLMQQSLKRKEEQEAKKLKQQEDLLRKREEDRRRNEEQERKKEEDKKRKQTILEEYKMKKQMEEDEKKGGGPVASNAVKKGGKFATQTKSRPKSLAVNSSFMHDYASLDTRPSKLSASTSNGTAASSCDTVDRSASNARLFSDVSSASFGSNACPPPSVHMNMNSTGSSRPPSVLSSCSRLTSAPSSVMPTMPPLYQRRGPPSDGGSEGSAFSEYNGPKLYVKPVQKSNRGIILNAINIVLGGTVNADMKKHVLEEINKSDSKYFLILFRGAGLQFRSIYSYCPEREEVIKLHGNGPKNVTTDMIEKYYKYNSGNKNFIAVHTRSLSITIDGFSIFNHLWGVGGRRPASQIIN